MKKPPVTSKAPFHSEKASGSRFGLVRLGWTASMPTAQMSWMTSTPSVMRPGSVSSSNLSLSSFTTTNVLDRLMQAAR